MLEHYVNRDKVLVFAVFGKGFVSIVFAELETKRILLEIFKDKQQKSQEAGTIPSFYKKACSLHGYFYSLR